MSMVDPNIEVIPNTDKLDKLAAQAQTNDQGTAFMEPGTKQKRKPGRPSKDEAAKKASEQKAKALNQAPGASAPSAPSAQPHIPTSMIARPLVEGISGLAMQYAGDPRAQMTPDELEGMAVALGLVMDKYAPDMFAKYGAEAMLAITMGQYGLRVMALKRVVEMEKAQKAAQFQYPPKPPEIKQDLADDKKDETMNSFTPPNITM